MTPDDRRDHIFKVTDDLGAIVIVDRELVCDYVECDDEHDPHGFAQYRKRPFAGAPVLPPLVYLSHDPGTSTETYLVALHELGHLTKGRGGGILSHEAFAWTWALKLAGEEPDSELWARIHRDLKSYARCRRCKADQSFTRLLAKAAKLANGR